MTTPSTVIQRYRRTDRGRGEWQSIDATWKTPASAGLVSHDVYHHLPGDTGTFAEEVATLGAEWYIERQPLGTRLPKSGEKHLKTMERNTRDTVQNAVESREAHPYAMPRRHVQALSAEETAYFDHLARVAFEELAQAGVSNHYVQADFHLRFLENLLWGYEQAKTRFPDQAAVREGSAALSATLAYMDKSEVPFGHEVTLTLEGYTCTVTYEDADAAFLEANQVLEAFMMPWCSSERGYPLKHLTLHASTKDYVDFLTDHFHQQESQADLPDEELLIPQNEQHGLRKVYVLSAETQQVLRTTGSLKLPTTALQTADYTPRDVAVL